MRRYELLSHTADVRIHAEGSTVQELFLASLQGLCAVLEPVADLNQETTYSTEQVVITSIDKTALLIDFLSEALYLMYSGRVLLFACNLDWDGTGSLTAVFRGIHSGGFENDVKAVTYHEAEVQLNDKGNYECTIVLDI